jgi:hypothetical protein
MLGVMVYLMGSLVVVVRGGRGKLNIWRVERQDEVKRYNEVGYLWLLLLLPQPPPPPGAV